MNHIIVNILMALLLFVCLQYSVAIVGRLLLASAAVSADKMDIGKKNLPSMYDYSIVSILWSLFYYFN